jgi:hypothetical protein
VRRQGPGALLEAHVQVHGGVKAEGSAVLVGQCLHRGHLHTFEVLKPNKRAAALPHDALQGIARQVCRHVEGTAVPLQL